MFHSFNYVIAPLSMDVDMWHIINVLSAQHDWISVGLDLSCTFLTSLCDSFLDRSKMVLIIWQTLQLPICLTTCLFVTSTQKRLLNPVYFWNFHNSSSHNLVIHYTNFYCYHTTKVKWSNLLTASSWLSVLSICWSQPHFDAALGSKRHCDFMLRPALFDCPRKYVGGIKLTKELTFVK